jgi:hypothetical protein
MFSLNAKRQSGASIRVVTDCGVAAHLGKVTSGRQDVSRDSLAHTA